MGYQPLKTANDEWSNKIFTVDPETVQNSVPYNVALSDEIGNNSDSENMDVVVCFDSIDPGASVNNIQPSYYMTVFVEEETTAGSWIPIAESFSRRITGTRGIHTVKFVIQSRFAGDTGQPFDINNGVRYNSNETPSENLRVRVEAVETNPSGEASLNSVVLTGSYRLY